MADTRPTPRSTRNSMRRATPGRGRPQLFAAVLLCLVSATRVGAFHSSAFPTPQRQHHHYQQRPLYASVSGGGSSSSSSNKKRPPPAASQSPQASPSVSSKRSSPPSAPPPSPTKAATGSGSKKPNSSPPQYKRPSSSSPPLSPKKKPSKPEARLGTDWAWSLSSKRTLPSLSTPYPSLPLPQLLAWERDGHTLTKALCSADEMEDYIKIVRAAFEKEKLSALRQKIRVMLGQEAYNDCQTVEECEEVMDEYIDQDMVPFLQTFNGWRKYQDVRQLALARRFAKVAAQLLNVPRVRLYQDSTFLKRSGDGPTLWHSDLNMAPFHTNDAVTLWLPLTPIAPEEEGGTGLLFASKSHRDFALSFWEDAKGGGRRDLEGRYGLKSYGRMEVGDGSWHHGWCLHSSGPNDEEEDRVAFSLCFVADGVEMLNVGEEGKGRGPDDEDEESYREWKGEVGARVGEKEHVFLPLVWDEAWEKEGEKGGGGKK